MSAAWMQGGSPPDQRTGSQQTHKRRHILNPPPVCFNCGVAGHFVVACPQKSRGNSIIYVSNQQFQAPPPPVSSYQRPRPPPPPQQNSTYPSTYPPNQRYSSNAAQQPFGQQPQQYNAPPLVVQYSDQGYQAPAYPHSQATGSFQHLGPNYGPHTQQYAPPATPEYQQIESPYPQANYTSGYASPFQPYQQPPLSTWNSTAAPINKKHLQRTSSFSGPPRLHSSTSSHHSRKSFQQSASSSQNGHHQMRHPSPIALAPNQASQNQALGMTANEQGSSGGSHEFVDEIPVESQSSKPKSISQKPHGQSACDVLTRQATSNIGQQIIPSINKGDAENNKLTDGDDVQELWEWNYEQIFKEPPEAETVALAQPLADGFKSTPVPLVQAWSTAVPSVSRYARKDNLKEFVRSIRSSPQWSYLQEDPAFADAPLEGPMIPLEEVPAWVAERHGMAVAFDDAIEYEEPKDFPRKRRRSEEPECDEQNNIDYQISGQVQAETKEPAIKRQRNNLNSKQPDEIMCISRSGTPVISNERSGTPYLSDSAPADNDAWAPQPGETAVSPGDPTGTLLASLGIIGCPKTVKPENNASPAGEKSLSQASSPILTVSQNASLTPVVSHASFLPASSSQANQSSQLNINGLHQSTPPEAPPSTNRYHSHPGGKSQHRKFSNAPCEVSTLSLSGVQSYMGPDKPQFENQTPANAPYSNLHCGPPAQVPGNLPYVPSCNVSYNYEPASDYAQPNIQYEQGPHHNSVSLNPPSNTEAQPYSQYAQPQFATYGPNGATANGFYRQATLIIYSPGGPQYGAPQATYGNGQLMQGQYSHDPHINPVQYGPAQMQHQTANPHPSQPYTYPVPYGQASNPNYQNAPQLSIQYQNEPPVHLHYATEHTGQTAYHRMPNSHPQYTNSTSGQAQSSNGLLNEACVRRDSHDNNPQNSNSRGKNPSDPNQNQNAVYKSQFAIYKGKLVEPTDDLKKTCTECGTDENTDSPLSPTSAEILGKLKEKYESAESHSHRQEPVRKTGNTTDSPLSPTSAEILGKLEGSAESNSRRESMRKLRRPPPKVEAAYSRRW